ncbi:MAG: CDP-alcohol phosphatidyltransferase family protein [Planctomycetes bacterium]|nr:CDP-alcohol phosphatidyltransferase family protein [Planctomycetota bacterium]
MAKEGKGIIRHVPNALTVGRLVLTVIFLGMILYTPKLGEEHPSNFLLVTFILFVVTGVTDIVDGKIARAFNVTSKFGRIVDPLADKFLVCGAFLCFAIVGQPQMYQLQIPLHIMNILRWSAVVIIIARELLVTIIRHIAEAKGVNFAATVSGKLKMFLQSFTLGAILMGWAYVEGEWGDWFKIQLYLLMLASTIISGFRAVRRSTK